MSGSGIGDFLLPPTLRARLVSLGVDYLVILGWLLVLTLVGFLVRPMLPSGAAAMSLWRTDLLAFGFTVLPVWVYLTVTEAGRAQATIGKRVARLKVFRQDGLLPGFGRVAARNAVKLLPWQLGHLAVSRAILDVHLPVAVVADVVSLGLVVVTVVMAIHDPQRRALHDRVAGTRVAQPAVGEVVG